MILYYIDIVLFHVIVCYIITVDYIIVLSVQYSIVLGATSIVVGATSIVVIIVVIFDIGIVVVVSVIVIIVSSCIIWTRSGYPPPSPRSLYGHVTTISPIICSQKKRESQQKY